jgi:hypothetical protein
VYRAHVPQRLDRGELGKHGDADAATKAMAVQ